jgi:hypothetical protein
MEIVYCFLRALTRIVEGDRKGWVIVLRRWVKDFSIRALSLYTAEKGKEKSWFLATKSK